MVRSLFVRLVCPIVVVAAAVAGWDAEAGCHRSRRAACCEPVYEEVVYETVRPAACCAPACPAPCPPVACCRPRYVEHATVVVEEVVVPAARCCASIAPTTVIADTVVVTTEPSWTPAPTTGRGRLVAVPASRRLR